MHPFQIGLFSLSNMDLRFLSVFSWLDSSFFFFKSLNNIPLSDIPEFIHSVTEGHLGCF